MWEQEKVHLTTFNRLLPQHRARPTLLLPIWHLAGYALGAGTALLGKEGAMACTVAVEVNTLIITVRPCVGNISVSAVANQTFLWAVILLPGLRETSLSYCCHYRRVLPSTTTTRSGHWPTPTVRSTGSCWRPSPSSGTRSRSTTTLDWSTTQSWRPPTKPCQEPSKSAAKLLSGSVNEYNTRIVRPVPNSGDNCVVLHTSQIVKL